ncbi:hypothetical protein VOLCADRAFT_103500 [Volvox carteri f. nagariensis]|uniref:Hydroxyproline O-arabinosyltransferase-like domain-containing protein n=1 Tax=Volvox carteri f. nagariensis TaxID=3068 RepID=D8TMA7_VOLCA|nr:uncharacterized protein VOLCADRAFT_103500 [Volvox carteri f. nagariensis]EFJ51470.1 hypothetical protein VOLCADRAFT_103500 [Volvox carteri f. nagariensis]|eukprot:XP_002947422.1 hypothetical protein VOLCADRAFT_103500 [Volvox carteri f. nagariensis]
MLGRRGAGRGEVVSTWHKIGATAAGIVAGYLLGVALMETVDMFYATPVNPTAVALSGNPGQGGGATKVGGKTIHSVLTSNGSPYQNFQGRIMPKGTNTKLPGDTIHSIFTCGGDYYQDFQSRIISARHAVAFGGSTSHQFTQEPCVYGTYKLVQKMPGGDKLTGFTRILHRMKPDELMDEIPTFRANPLHPECDEWCDFPVADRPNAVKQWLDAAAKEPGMIKGAWILLLECDYVWMRPVQAPDAYDTSAVGFQFMFDYIMPEHPCRFAAVPFMNKLSGGRVEPKDIPRSGPAPVLIRYTDLAALTPDWERVTAAIEADPEAVKQLDWVREMYAWDIALALHNVSMVTETPPHSRLIAQPPHDLVLGDAAMCHYTWGTLYFENKKEIWKWEKRDYTSREVALKVPLLTMPPQPWKEGWVLQDNLPVTRELHELVTGMIGQMNKAISTLPDLSNAPLRT